MTEQESGKVPEEAGATREQVVRPGLTWRALAVSVAVAVVLAVAATLLLRDAFCPTGAGLVAGTRAVGSCCLPRGTK